jgi:hypothetical protein
MLAFEAELASFPALLLRPFGMPWNTFRPMWKPSEEHDKEIRRWMKLKGWGVTRTNYDPDRQVFAWRHDVRGGPSPTLRISRQVIESYPAFALLYHLDELKVVRAMGVTPKLA